MTREEKLAYQRGYNARATDRWPAHKLPLPPDPVVRKLIEALAKLRQDSDCLLASMFEPDDPIRKRLDPALDAADDALAGVSEWLKKPEDNDTI